MEFRMRWKGTVPLIMRDVQKLIDPSHPLTKKLKEETSKRGSKKTDEVHAEISRLEYYGGMYYDPKLGPYAPARTIQACLRDGAKRTSEGQTAVRGIMITHLVNPLLYAGPRTIDALWADENFRDVRAARPPGSRGTVVRTRPIFHEWSLEFDGWLDTAILDAAKIEAFATEGGLRQGFMDHRPQYGHFEVEWMRVL